MLDITAPATAYLPDDLDRPPLPRSPFAALTDSELGMWIDDYSRIADCGRAMDGTLLCQRDLDTVQTELRVMRAERDARKAARAAIVTHATATN